MLKEAEHRSTFYIPYWNLPLASVLGECLLACLLGWCCWEQCPCPVDSAAAEAGLTPAVLNAAH